MSIEDKGKSSAFSFVCLLNFPIYTYVELSAICTHIWHSGQDWSLGAYLVRWPTLFYFSKFKDLSFMGQIISNWPNHFYFETSGFQVFFFNFMMRKVWKEFKNWLKIAKIFSSIIHIFTTMNNFAIFEKAFFTTTVQFSLLVQLRKWWAEKKVLGGLIYMLGRVEHENWISVKVVVFLNALLPA